MCRYGSHKSHYVCVDCRVSMKQSMTPQREHPCPRCGRAMRDAGRDFAAPRRRDDAGWRALAAALAAGLDFHSCGCQGPGYRPNTPAEVHRRLIFATRQGLSIEEALQIREPG